MHKILTVKHTVNSKYYVKDSEGFNVHCFVMCSYGKPLSVSDMVSLKIKEVSYEGFICLDGDENRFLEDCTITIDCDGNISISYYDNFRSKEEYSAECLRFDTIACDFQSDLDLSK